MNHYEALGVPEQATQAEIEAAFEKQRQPYLPKDQSPDPMYPLRSAKPIFRAYAILHDPKRREEYDASLGRMRQQEELDRDIAMKVEAEQSRRDERAMETIKFARQKASFGRFAEMLGGSLAVIVGIGGTILFFWALISSVRWLWNHPLF